MREPQCTSIGPKGTYGRFCFGCYANGRKRSNIPGHRGYKPPKTDRVTIEEITLVKKPSEHGGQKVRRPGHVLCSFLEKHPSILEYLTTCTWEDATPREPSALSITIDYGMVQVALNDKDLKQSCYTKAESLPEALELMDTALRDNIIEWRQWKSGKRK